ncbi:MAG: sugar phosphate isomerase/epimerase [Chthoniobacterales bacterium]|nr:sugar phosphate isomerase/epimerase [Chthoniobacterales bacterium]
MKILLHTIALEPARWLPQRVTRPLVELLPHIAKAGFRELEVFEPHLTADVESQEIRGALEQYELLPVILSSYLNLNPAATSDAELEEKLGELAGRVAFYGFKKVRLFPGSKMDPADREGVEIFQDRVRRVAARMADGEVLLETHDGSLADDPAIMVRIVQNLALPNVGLLFQPTNFLSRESILAQFRLQRPFIRHLHLQSRMADLSMARLGEGLVPWPEIFSGLSGSVDATLEFVPAGICPPESFDLSATIQQAAAEAAHVRTLIKSA